MRRFAIAVAAAAIACQAGLAGSPAPLTLTRANTSFEQFQQDRDDCRKKTAEVVHRFEGSARPAYVPITQNGMATPNNVWPASNPPPRLITGHKANPGEFLKCMTARGYQESPTEPQTEHHS